MITSCSGEQFGLTMLMCVTLITFSPFHDEIEFVSQYVVM